MDSKIDIAFKISLMLIDASENEEKMLHFQNLDIETKKEIRKLNDLLDEAKPINGSLEHITIILGKSALYRLMGDHLIK